MTVLRSLEGKFYDVPEDWAASFEIPRERVGEELGKAGALRSGHGGPGVPPEPSSAALQVFPYAMPGPDLGPPLPAGAPSGGGMEPYWGWNWPNYRGPWRPSWSNRWNGR